MASLVNCKLIIQESFVNPRPRVRVLASSAEVWSSRRECFPIGKIRRATQRSDSASKASSARPSVWKSKAFATTRAGGAAQSIHVIGAESEADFNEEAYTRKEEEARHASGGESPRDHGREERFSWRAENKTDHYTREEEGIVRQEGVNGACGGDEGGQGVGECQRGAVREAGDQVTSSVAESKRERRSRITIELLERGTSPIELLESMRTSLTAELFWTVVNILALNHRAHEALLVFDWWKRQDGYVATEHQYTRLISICGHGHMPDKAQKLFDEMNSLDGMIPTVATYSCLLQSFAEVGNFDAAKAILTEMREVGLKPNAITYTGLLHAYGKQGQYGEMAKIFNDMKTYQSTQPECAPSSVTYSALLMCYAKGGLFARMEKALKEMSSKDMIPDGNAVNAMIEGYAHAGLVKDMERMYALGKPYGVRVRADTIRTVALAYIRKSYFYQLGTFARYHNRRRVSLGNLIENLLLLSHAANFAMRGLAEEYVRLKEAGFQGDVTSYNIRALSFSRMQMLWDMRVTVLEMAHYEVMPDLVTYGAVVDAYVAGNLQTGLSRALAEMPNLDDIATIESDSIVFEAFGRGDFQVCCEEFVMGAAEDIDRKFITYANLVGYYLKRLEILSAKKVSKRIPKV